MPLMPTAWLCARLLKSAAALQTSKNLFILIPSLLGALLTLIALAVCGLFPRYILPLCLCYTVVFRPDFGGLLQVDLPGFLRLHLLYIYADL